MYPHFCPRKNGDSCLPSSGFHQSKRHLRSLPALLPPAFSMIPVGSYAAQVRIARIIALSSRGIAVVVAVPVSNLMRSELFSSRFSRRLSVREAISGMVCGVFMSFYFAVSGKFCGVYGNPVSFCSHRLAGRASMYGRGGDTGRKAGSGF